MAKALFVFVAALAALAQASDLHIRSFAHVGEKVEMRCNVDHEMYPIKSITWTKDGQQFYVYNTDSVNPTISHVDGVTVAQPQSSPKGYSIIVYPATQKTAGLYTCKVESAFGTAEMSGTLKVIGGLTHGPGYYGNSRDETYTTSQVEEYTTPRAVAYDHSRAGYYGNSAEETYTTPRDLTYGHARDGFYGNSREETYGSAHDADYTTARNVVYGQARDGYRSAPYGSTFEHF